MAQQIFRQLFDEQSSTYTYLLGDLKSKVVFVIDAVKEQVNRDLQLIENLGFQKLLLLSTHVHADHITGNSLIKSRHPQAKSYISKYYKNAKADVLIGEEDCLEEGDIKLNFLHTPGHTSGCLTIVDHANRRIFCGDTLLIRGCGRTDFQDGSSELLYDSVHNKLFTLPRDYLAYPAHDYNQRTVTSIGEEIKFNPRLTESKAKFIDIMSKLNLAYPKMIDIAVPANLKCGYGDFDSC